MSEPVEKKDVKPVTAPVAPVTHKAEPAKISYGTGFGDGSSWTPGFGSSIYMGSTKIGQSIDLGSPESELAKVKITNNDSPNSCQEYAPGLFDGNDMSFELVYEPSVLDTLWTAFAAKTISDWHEAYPDGSGWTWSGFITKLSTEGKTENEAIHGKITVQLTDDIAQFQTSGLS